MLTQLPPSKWRPLTEAAPAAEGEQWTGVPGAEERQSAERGMEREEGELPDSQDSQDMSDVR